MQFMPSLGITTRERVISRISFYLLLVGFAQISTWVFPDPEVREARSWAERGVVAPMIAVPLSDLSCVPANAIRVVR